jgi:hypothetical protein
MRLVSLPGMKTMPEQLYTCIHRGWPSNDPYCKECADQRDKFVMIELLQRIVETLERIEEKME